MQKYHFSFLLVIFLIFIQTVQCQIIEFKNTSAVDRLAEVVTIKRFDSYKDKFPLLKDEKGNLFPFQFDDKDKDGTWDEWAISISIKQKEVKKYKVQWVDSQEINKYKFETKTNLHFGKRQADGSYKNVDFELHPKTHIAQSEPWIYQYEGPGWENDKVAYRSYFDSRNGKDIFGKITSRMVLDSVMLYGNYHEFDARWGMDVLKVGKSLGMGAVAFVESGKIKRLGNADSMVYEKLIEGPLRSVFVIKYYDYSLHGEKRNISDEIEIRAGGYFYKHTLYINKPKNDTLLVGFANLKGVGKGEFVDLGTSKAVFTHGNQSENHDNLGLSVFTDIKTATYGDAPTEPDGDYVVNTSYLSAVAQEVNQFYVMGCWEKSDENFKTKQGFKDFLLLQMKKQAYPIEITIKK